MMIKVKNYAIFTDFLLHTNGIAIAIRTSTIPTPIATHLIIVTVLIGFSILDLKSSTSISQMEASSSSHMAGNRIFSFKTPS